MIIGAAIFTFCTCIDPYYPKLSGYESLLVVDGLVTDANSAYIVKISRTFADQSDTPFVVADASVSIEDDQGKTYDLIYQANGKYKSDSTIFKGEVGHKYTLHIITKDGQEYKSDPCLMYPVTDIEDVYYAKEEETTSNGTESNKGLRIYIDSQSGDPGQYYRWDYVETWKFKVPNPKRFNYINDSTILPVDKVNETCWKENLSGEIFIGTGTTGEIKKQPLNFIASAKSDRLLVRYSILVRQYSVSRDEYKFWNDIKETSQSGGDIFAKQPYSTSGNIHNINNSRERVLGYFSVSAVKEKRKYISFSETGNLGLPFYSYPCKRIVMNPDVYPHSPWDGPISWDELNSIYITAGYYFCEPEYVGNSNKLKNLIFALPECSDCELTGVSTKPDFWTD